MKMLNQLILTISVLTLIGCSNGNDKSKIEATGNIETVNVTISSKTAGEIKKIKYDEGDKVSVGDTIFFIDNESIMLQLKQAEAGRVVAEAQFGLLKKGARIEDKKQAEMMLLQADASLKQAKNDFDRMQNLYTSKSVTKKQFEDAQTRLDITQAQYNASKENYDKVKNFARPEELRQAEAKLNQMVATEDLIKKSFRDSYITSPINGIIVKKYFEKGESVSPMSSLVNISDLSKVNLYIYVTEEELGKVKLGQNADVYTDSFKEKPYKGKVIYISPEAEFTPKNIQTKDERTKLVYKVKIEIPNPNFELKSGMPADAVINLTDAK